MGLKNISSKSALSLDNVCYLISTTITKDEYHIEHEAITEKACFCAELPVFSTEFYSARRQGIRSNVTLVVDSESYSDETEVKYGDVTYSVYRVFPREDGMAELYLGKKLGVENG